MTAHSARRLAGVTALLLALGLGAAAAAQDSIEPAAETEAAPVSTTVAGTVLDRGGRPVAEATVVIASIPTPAGEDAAPSAPVRLERTTGEDGTFSVEVPPTEQAFVRVTADGRAPASIAVRPPFDPVSISLEPGSTVRLRVLDVLTGKPLSGVTATLGGPFENMFESPREATSNEEGLLRFDDVESPAPVLALERRGFTRVVQPLTVPSVPAGAESDPVVTLDDVFLKPGGRIAGVVVDGRGDPVGGVVVRARDGDPMRKAFGGKDERSARTDDHGAFSFDGLTADRSYLVTVTGDDVAATMHGPIVLERGADVDDLRIVVRGGGRIELRLAGPDGPPPAAAVTIRLRRLDSADMAESMRGSPPPTKHVNVEDSGRVAMTHVAPGSYVVVVDVEGFREKELDEIDVGDGRTIDLGEITLDPGRWIAGRVVDGNGDPVGDARVVAHWNEGRRSGSRTSRSSEDGGFRVLGLGDEPVKWIQADRDGAMSERIAAVAPGRDDLTLVLQPLGAVAGRVRLADGSIPAVFEARVKRQEGGARGGFAMMFGGPWKSFAQAEDGRFTIADVRPGLSSLEVRAPGTTVARVAEIGVRSNERTDVGDVVLEAGLVLRGRVVDAEFDGPVAGATVTPGAAGTMAMISRLDGGTTPIVQTDPDGAFVLQGLEPGRLAVAVEHPDFASASREFTLAAAAPLQDVEIRLSRGGTLTGTVRDADGLPVSGARLLVAQGVVGASAPTFLTTDIDGAYRVERLPPGNWVVARMPADGNFSIAGLDMRQATITAGGVTVIDFDERPAITLTGRLLRGDESVGGATLMFIPSGAGATLDITTAATDDSGWFEAGLARAGQYTVQVIGTSGTQLGGTEIQVPDEPIVEQDIELSAGAIRGVVRDRGGDPIEGAQLTATSPGPATLLSQRGGTALSGGDGTFEIGGLSEGPYDVVATAEGFATAPGVSVTLDPAGEPPPLEIVLERGRRVRGVVVDPSGAPVATAMVWAAAAGAAAAAFPANPTMTDGAGGFEVLVPRTGPATITVGGTAWAPRVVPVPPDAGETPFTIALSDGGALRVAVVDSGGAPRPGMSVFALPVDPALRTAMASSMRMGGATDENGRIEVRSLAPGGYTIEVLGGGGEPAVATVTENATTDVTITLP